jgi:molecular chaperone GrpE
MPRMNSWDRVAKWAGMGNNREDKQIPDEKPAEAQDRSGLEMQDEMKVGEQELTSNEAGGPVLVDEGVEQTPKVDAAELMQLKGERDQLIDRLARLQAEFDNARKREIKERSDAREYTIGTTVEPFLGVMDNFQLALKAQGSADQLRAGVELILKQMEEALKSLQVTPVETIGTQFDPRVHEALGSIETVEFPDHQVLEEIRRGYKIREKLLRPAMVRIAENKAVVNA